MKTLIALALFSFQSYSLTNLEKYEAKILATLTEELRENNFVKCNKEPKKLKPTSKGTDLLQISCDDHLTISVTIDKWPSGPLLQEFVFQADPNKPSGFSVETAKMFRERVIKSFEKLLKAKCEIKRAEDPQIFDFAIHQCTFKDGKINKVFEITYLPLGWFNPTSPFYDPKSALKIHTSLELPITSLYLETR